jgi:hypothetical protein
MLITLFKIKENNVQHLFKGTVSSDFYVFFIIYRYDIKSVLSVWTLMVYNFFDSGVYMNF